MSRDEEWDETRQTTSRSSRKRFTFRDKIFYVGPQQQNPAESEEDKPVERNASEERRKKFLENNKKTIFSLAKRTKTAMPVSHSHDAHSAYNLSRDSEGRRKRFFSTVVVSVFAVAR